MARFEDDKIRLVVIEILLKFQWHDKCRLFHDMLSHGICVCIQIPPDSVHFEMENISNFDFYN